MHNLPMAQSQANATGLAATNPIAVPGLKSTDVLLSVVKWKAGEIADGVNPNDFTVGAGTITHATVDLSTYILDVTWTHA